MKASTLFALTVAILLGLVVVGVAKYTGVFAKAPPPQQPEVKVLVAANNLFEGMALSAPDVRVRPLTPRELEAYKGNEDKYLPALPEAVNLRVPKRNIEADTPLLREDFEDVSLPEPLHRRLEPGMRAVNVSLPKDRCAGGLIQVGERVDVYLTTQISRPGHPEESVTQTAPIARNLKIISKRNMLWTALAAVPEDRPLQFTLQANPYRAALIEFAAGKGQLSLVLTPTGAEKKGGVRPTADAGSGSEADSKEYRDEDQRVQAFLSGELSVGEPDLERIFNLRPFHARVPPSTVELYTGTSLKQTVTVVNPNTDAEAVSDSPNMPRLSRPSLGYQFRAPQAAGANAGGVPIGATTPSEFSPSSVRPVMPINATDISVPQRP
jgi:Flp pilus assembly protein CpaB